MFVGIDLAAKEKNPTGFAFANRKLELKILHTDVEILEKINYYKPKVVAIDAPLSLPKGTLRPAERELIAEGYKLLPITGAMRTLARRAVALKKKIGAEVIEVHPTSSNKILKLKRKEIPAKNKHEFDAALAAITAKCYYLGKYRAYGRKNKIILPL